MEFLEVYIYCILVLIAVVIGVDILEKFNDGKGRKK